MIVGRAAKSQNGNKNTWVLFQFELNYNKIRIKQQILLVLAALQSNCTSGITAAKIVNIPR